nr:immunoglobulin heavy chain junction region [Mus musculus]MBK4187373.1 immunoglobulin heavy chain junction region [Mus musculus]
CARWDYYGGRDFDYW